MFRHASALVWLTIVGSAALAGFTLAAPPAQPNRGQSPDPYYLLQCSDFESQCTMNATITPAACGDACSCDTGSLQCGGYNDCTAMGVQTLCASAGDCECVEEY